MIITYIHKMHVICLQTIQANTIKIQMNVN